MDCIRSIRQPPPTKLLGHSQRLQGKQVSCRYRCRNDEIASGIINQVFSSIYKDEEEKEERGKRQKARLIRSRWRRMRDIRFLH